MPISTIQTKLPGTPFLGIVPDLATINSQLDTRDNRKSRGASDFHLFSTISKFVDHADIESNPIYNSARTAIAASGNDAEVRRNIIRNTPIGILKSASMLPINAMGNHFEDVDNPFVDPNPLLTTPDTTHPERQPHWTRHIRY
jgi:hypothetical protein